MPHYIKTYLERRQREKFKSKVLQKAKLRAILGTKSSNPQLQRFKNYCLITKASRSVHYRLGLSRHILRKYGTQGYINGMKSSSW